VDVLQSAGVDLNLGPGGVVAGQSILLYTLTKNAVQLATSFKKKS